MAAPVLSNIARAAKILALLLFLLPWVTISCSPQALGQAGGADAAALAGAGDVTIARGTGAQLAMGTVVATNPTPSAGPPPNPFNRPNYAIMGGVLLILLSLAATFLLQGGRGAIAAAGGCALAALALCYAMLVQVPNEVRTSFAGGAGTGGQGAPPIDPLELARLIQVKVEIGFWLTIAALVAAILLNLLAMKGSGASAASAAPAAAPAAPPPE